MCICILLIIIILIIVLILAVRIRLCRYKMIGMYICAPSTMVLNE